MKVWQVTWHFTSDTSHTEKVIPEEFPFVSKTISIINNFHGNFRAHDHPQYKIPTSQRSSWDSPFFHISTPLRGQETSRQIESAYHLSCSKWEAFEPAKGVEQLGVNLGRILWYSKTWGKKDMWLDMFRRKLHDYRLNRERERGILIYRYIGEYQYTNM